MKIHIVKTVNQNHTEQKQTLRFSKVHFDGMGNLNYFIAFLKKRVLETEKS